MRPVYKKDVARELEKLGYRVSEFNTVDHEEGHFTLKYKDSGLLFTFIQSRLGYDTFSTSYTAYVPTRTLLQFNKDVSLDKALNSFQSWLNNQVKPYTEDLLTEDPFKTNDNEPFKLFQDEEPIENDVKLTEQEVVTFTEELNKLQSYITTQFQLQEKQIAKVNETINVLIEASKEEKKSTLKKVFNKGIIEIMKIIFQDKLVEGFKFFLNYFQHDPTASDPSKWIA